MDMEPVDTSELQKLKDMLEANGMECEWDEDPALGGASICIPSRDAFAMRAGFSVIQIYGSEGADCGLLEMWGHGMKNPEGFLSAEDVLRKLEEH